MQRSALKRGVVRLKSRGPKMTPIRKSAQGEDCQINLPGICNHDPATVVWCHENSYAAGKGMGLKARDECGAYGCSACHAVYDRQVPRPDHLSQYDVEQLFAEAVLKSNAILRNKDLL